MDMLVKLYEVQEDAAHLTDLRQKGITLKKVISPELYPVINFVREQFGEGWAGEATAAIIKNHCWIAVQNKQIIGFACYDATMPDFFGPTGVRPDMRGLGVGKALLIQSLLSMREMGYAYAIIGWPGPSEFYAKCVGAIDIPDSTPYSYHDLIHVDVEVKKA